MHVIVSYTLFILPFSLHARTFAEMQELLLLGVALGVKRSRCNTGEQRDHYRISEREMIFLSRVPTNVACYRFSLGRTEKAYDDASQWCSF